MNCVITGAAAGIGLALTRRFAGAGFDVTAVDCDRTAIDRILSERHPVLSTVHWVVSDLGSAEDRGELIRKLAHGTGIEVLIHNAGINVAGRFSTADPKPWESLIEVNLLAPMELTTGLLPSLRDKSSLVFVSSLSHFVSYPGAAVYAATKDGLASYARSVGCAFRSRHISVLTVFPGPTRTAQAREASPDNSREHKRMDPDKVAERILKAIQNRRHRLVPGVSNRLAAAFGRLLPRASERAMRRAIFQKLPP